jgi:hypothetical protein
MREALQLFEEIVNSKWFVETPIILFLNKCDLFREKIVNPRFALSAYFPDYHGNNTYEDGVEYIEKKFLSLNQTPKKIFTHVTCCTDTKQIKFVFDSVRQILMRSQLSTLDLDL